MKQNGRPVYITNIFYKLKKDHRSLRCTGDFASSDECRDCGTGDRRRAPLGSPNCSPGIRDDFFDVLKLNLVEVRELVPRFIGSWHKRWNRGTDYYLTY